MYTVAHFSNNTFGFVFLDECSQCLSSNLYIPGDAVVYLLTLMGDWLWP